MHRTADALLAPLRTATTGLPVHPRTGLTAIGHLPGGRPVWPIAGADDTVTPPVTEPVTPTPTEPVTPPADAEDKTDWKAEARKWEDRAKGNKAAADKLAKIEADGATELEKAQNEAATATKTATAATERAVRAEVRALADGFVDRTDAVLRLGELTKYVDEVGDVDEKKIKTALADVLKEHPHLAKPDVPEPVLKPGQKKPVEQLKPGAAPAAPDGAAKSLEDALANALNPT